MPFPGNTDPIAEVFYMNQYTAPWGDYSASGVMIIRAGGLVVDLGNRAFNKGQVSRHLGTNADNRILLYDGDKVATRYGTSVLIEFRRNSFTSGHSACSFTTADLASMGGTVNNFSTGFVTDVNSAWTYYKMVRGTVTPNPVIPTTGSSMKGTVSNPVTVEGGHIHY